MKYNYFIAAGLLLSLSSCRDDDTSWKSEIANLKQELSSQKSLVEALQNGNYVAGIQSFSDYYTIMFSNGQSITLKNGQTPEITIGSNGNWYINGEDSGKSSQGACSIIGPDGVTPVFSIGSNGNWYIDGEDTGVVAEGKNGSDAPVIESVVMLDNTFIFNFSDNTSISCLAQLSSTDIYGLPTLSDNPLQTINYSAGFASIFKTWGFIGDSFSSGTARFMKEDSTLGFIQDYDYSWGQRLCKLCGSSGFNYGVGGQTTYGWITNEDSRTWYGAKDSPKQAYIIALGYNDVFGGAAKKGEITTDVNFSDYSKNANTFAGNIFGIVQRIKSIKSDAYIFMVTLPKVGYASTYEYDKWNDIIREMPKYFENTYVLDLYKYAPVYDDEFKSKYYLYDHMSAAGYQYTAYMFATYIDWIVRKNPADFRDVAVK